MKSSTNLNLELNQFLCLRLYRKVLARFACGSQEKLQLVRDTNTTISIASVPSSVLRHDKSACACLSHRHRRSPRLSTTPGDRETGRAAVRLSLHNKPGFSKEEHRRRDVTMEAALRCFRIQREYCLQRIFRGGRSVDWASSHMWESYFAEGRLLGVLLHFLQQRSYNELCVHTCGGTQATKRCSAALATTTGLEAHGESTTNMSCVSICPRIGPNIKYCNENWE